MPFINTSAPLITFNTPTLCYVLIPIVSKSAKRDQVNLYFRNMTDFGQTSNRAIKHRDVHRPYDNNLASCIVSHGDRASIILYIWGEDVFVGCHMKRTSRVNIHSLLLLSLSWVTTKHHFSYRNQQSLLLWNSWVPYLFRAYHLLIACFSSCIIRS